MRLTLRTLLAYRDGVLSSAETSDLHQRINQTEVASNLLRRIEALVQQKQMLAPKAIGEGLGGDANSVAEYLDDCLPSDQVAEFERICIAESDLVLAELAHCHQLLADALSSKVHVPTSLKAIAVGVADPEQRAALAARLRTVRVKRSKDKVGHSVIANPNGEVQRVDDAHSSALVTAVEVPAEEVTVEQSRATNLSGQVDAVNAAGIVAKNENGALQVRAPLDVIGSAPTKPPNAGSAAPKTVHQVPEYLAAQSSSGWRIPAAIIAVLGLFLLLVVQALGPLADIKNLFVATEGLANKSPGPNPNEVAESRDSESRAVDKLASEPRIVDDSNGDSQNSSSVPSDSTALESKLRSDNSAEVGSGKTSKADVDKQMLAPEDTATNPASGGADEPNTEKANTEKPSTENGEPSARDSSEVIWSAANSDLRAVLLTRTATADGSTLERVTPSAAIPKNVELIVPPAMRPTLDFGNVCKWTVCGPTRLTHELDAQGNMKVSTSLCRALVRAYSQGNAIQVATPAGLLNVQFADASSMASIEAAYRSVAFGPVTDKRAFKPFAIVVAVEGEVTVTVGPTFDSGVGANEAAKPVNLNVGEAMAFVDGKVVEFELGTIPAWYRSNVPRPLDALAAMDMDKLLSETGSTQAQLNSMCQNNRPETAALAIQTTLMLGDWSGFAKYLLGDESMRTQWENTLSLAAQILADDPASIEEATRELDAVYGESSSKLLSLLVGSAADEQANASADATLQEWVDSLSSDRLEERVLAAYQLRRVSGKDLGFQPSTPNRASVQQWRREIVTNKSLTLPTRNPIWESKQPLSEW